MIRLNPLFTPLTKKAFPHRKTFLTLLVFALIAASPAHATVGDKLQQVEKQLGEQKEKAKALDQKAAETTTGLKTLRQNLIDATEALQTKAEEVDRLDDKMDQLASDIASRKTALASEKQKLNVFTNALIELSRQPPEADFLQTRLTTDYIHRTILMRALVPRIREQTETIAGDIATLNDMQTRIAEQKTLLTSAQENLEEQQHSLDQLIKARQGLLQRTEAQKQAIAAQLVSLTGEARNLRQLMDRVNPQHKRGSAHAPTSQTRVKAPVAGTLIRPFGQRDTDGVMSEGLTFTALPGAPVVAPLAGRVVFAGPFHGYGQVLILQHEGGAHSFLAGFGRIDAEMGQEVLRGEPLGVLPVKTKSKPELYFEWRRNNEPVEPVLEPVSVK